MMCKCDYSLPSGVWPHGYVQHRHPLPYRRHHITHSEAESEPLLVRYWSQSDLQTLVLPPFSYVSGPLSVPGTSDDKKNSQFTVLKKMFLQHNISKKKFNVHTIYVHFL